MLLLYRLLGANCAFDATQSAGNQSCSHDDTTAWEVKSSIIAAVSVFGEAAPLIVTAQRQMIWRDTALKKPSPLTPVDTFSSSPALGGDKMLSVSGKSECVQCGTSRSVPPQRQEGQSLSFMQFFKNALIVRKPHYFCPRVHSQGASELTIR